MISCISLIVFLIIYRHGTWYSFFDTFCLFFLIFCDVVKMRQDNEYSNIMINVAHFKLIVKQIDFIVEFLGLLVVSTIKESLNKF